MSDIDNHRAYEIAAKLGDVLEQERAGVVGVALGIVLGQFILLLERSDDGISDGIDAIAGDAKQVAINLRNLLQ